MKKLIFDLAKNRRTLAIMLLISLFSLEGKSQQLPLYSQAHEYPILLNPAYAGQDSLTHVLLIYRDQWSSIPGTPVSQVVSISGRFKGSNIGVGAMITNEVANILGKTGGYITASYFVQLNTDHSLRFGMNIGAVQQRIMFDNVQIPDPNDPALLSGSQNNTAIDGSLGLIYTFRDNLELTMSSQQIFGNSIEYTDQANQKAASFKLLRHYFVSGKYTIPLSAELNLSILAGMRSTQSLSAQFEIGGRFEWRDKLWATVYQRQDYGTIFNFGFALLDNVKLGYAYDAPIGGLTIQNTGGTHELSLFLGI